MTYQRQLCNGSWIDTTDQDAARILDNALAFQANVASMRREPAPTLQHMHAELNRGEHIRFAPDWYMNIRLKPAPRAQPIVTLVRCSCGHSVPQSQVMRASLGTSCPSCYDRMSD